MRTFNAHKICGLGKTFDGVKITCDIQTQLDLANIRIEGLEHRFAEIKKLYENEPVINCLEEMMLELCD